jgi:hypothetical protein
LLDEQPASAAAMIKPDSAAILKLFILVSLELNALNLE